MFTDHVPVVSSCAYAAAYRFVTSDAQALRDTRPVGGVGLQEVLDLANLDRPRVIRG